MAESKTRLGHRQLSAMKIAADTGGCVAGKGGDSTWGVCSRLRDLGLFQKSQRTCFTLTDAGWKRLAEAGQ